MWWMMIPAMMQATGAILGADAEVTSAKIKRAELRNQANAELAQSSLQAEEAVRQAAYQESRVLAIGAASGGGASSPDIVNRMAKWRGEGEREALASLYTGKTSYDSLRKQGKYGVQSAKIARNQAILGGAAQVGGAYAQSKLPYGGQQSMYQRYGQGGYRPSSQGQFWSSNGYAPYK